ncbi:MAG: calcium/sodium antiporter [Anaerobutyricum sp.]|nr:calcium/sodium antiporter [Eubacterium sp.]MDY6047179.1 calcium/sodium antiporter [Anaerobutyricum sp.]
MLYMSFLIGLLFICKGGDWFVDASTYIARAFGIPKYIIGATIVSFATTMPEMIVSVAAALKGSSVMAIGNAVGSVSANTGIILGISLICLPAAIRREEYLMKNLLYLGCLVMLLISFQDNIFSPSDSILLILSGILFLSMNVKNAVKTRKEKEQKRIVKKELTKNLIYFVLGAAAIVAGSHLLIQSACEIAKQLHISEDIISVTILAMGTSLPEFVTTITAIIKKESALSVGNIVGANVIDTAFILPVCTLITGEHLSVGTQMKLIDLPICLILSAIALLPMLFRQKIGRQDGIIVLLIYIAYFVSITGLI